MKPKVYWRPVWHEDQDPDDACWAVKIGNMDIGIGTWEEAYRWAYLTVALERLEA
jgi:hypothetical protein